MLKIGQKLTRWKVVSYHHKNIHRQSYWLVRCICGIEKVVQESDLKSGKSRSCGCISREFVTKRNTTHGLCRKHPAEYHTWKRIKARCYNKNTPEYKSYGGRGITVCEPWLDKQSGFVNFLKDMKEKPSSAHSIDRINNEGNYEPLNCHWATKEEQAQNQRDTLKPEEVLNIRKIAQIF